MVVVAYIKTMKPTFMSSTKEGNPPIDMNVTNPKTKDAQAPLACVIENGRAKLHVMKNSIPKPIMFFTPIDKFGW